MAHECLQVGEIERGYKFALGPHEYRVTQEFSSPPLSSAPTDPNICLLKLYILGSQETDTKNIFIDDYCSGCASHVGLALERVG